MNSVLKIQRTPIVTWMSEHINRDLPQYWKERLNIVSLGAGDARNDLILSQTLPSGCAINKYLLIDNATFSNQWDSNIKAKEVKRITADMESVKLNGFPIIIAWYSQSLHTSKNPNKVLQETTFGPNGAPFTFITENLRHPFCKSYLEPLHDLLLSQAALKTEKKILEVGISVEDMNENDFLLAIVGQTDRSTLPKHVVEFVDEKMEEFHKIQKSTEEKKEMKLADMYSLLISRRTYNINYDPIEIWAQRNKSVK